jgi:hypothetical protein
MKDNVIRQTKVAKAVEEQEGTNKMTKAELIDKIKGTKGAPDLTKKQVSLR